MSAAPASHRAWRRWQLVAAGVLLALLAAMALGEWRGWPFLVPPLQRVLSDRLERSVDLSADAAGSGDVRLRFVGGVQLRAPRLVVGAPAWSQAPHLLQANEVAVDLRYVDLWRAYRGEPLRVQRLEAETLDSHLERRADGHASWQFGSQPPDAAPRPLSLPRFVHQRLGSADLHVHDEILAVHADGRVSPGGGARPAWRLEATGRFRDLPLKLELLASDGDTATAPTNVRLKAEVGRSRLAFDGHARGLQDLGGRFSVQGPSLAAVGDTVGVTLPTTGAFRAEGSVVRNESLWQVAIDDATVGSSRLRGAFAYGPMPGPGPARPMLTGRLGGSRLLLSDLGPAVGVSPASTGAARRPGRVLPDRAFDLPALRAMDANVLIDIAEVDLNTTFLEPLRPLRAYLLLSNGVMTLRDVDARTAQGRLQGRLNLDGRDSPAGWTTDLRWDGVRLERWLRQARADGAPPFVSGRLSGKAALTGQGRSTAEILGSLRGSVRTELHEGSISHATIEAAGLDLAESLGLLIRGDDALPVHCAVADLAAEKGVLRPRVMVVDTADSAIWIDGSLSLVDETLDLRAVVAPKDFSPLALRTPLRVRGSLAKPEVSIEKGALGRKLASSLLLGLINPLAALIPLVDTGNADGAERSATGCQALMRRGAARRTDQEP